MVTIIYLHRLVVTRKDLIKSSPYWVNDKKMNSGVNSTEVVQTNGKNFWSDLALDELIFTLFRYGSIEGLLKSFEGDALAILIVVALPFGDPPEEFLVVMQNT